MAEITKEPFQIEVVNDIGVILRIQGRSFERAHLYEPKLALADMSIFSQKITNHLQRQGAKTLGVCIAESMIEVADSDLGRRLQRDKWLTHVISAICMRLGQGVQLPRADVSTEVGIVPPEPDDRRLRIKRDDWK